MPYTPRSTIAMTMRYAHLAPGGGRAYLAALEGQNRGHLTTTQGGALRTGVWSHAKWASPGGSDHSRALERAMLATEIELKIRSVA